MAAITLPTAPKVVNRKSNPPRFIPLPAHEALTAGQACYINSDGELALADADAAATAFAEGIVLKAAAVGATADLLVYGEVEGYASLTQGTTVVIHTTAGSYTQNYDISDPTANGDLAAADVVSQLGVALSATRILIRPVKIGTVLAA